MCFGGGGGSSQAAAAQAQATQQQNQILEQQAQQTQADADARQAAITQGQQNINNAFSQFDDNWFNQISQNYKNYAQPQLDDQYGVAKNNVTYSLARNGTTNSSMAGYQFGQLAKEYGINQDQIDSTADNYANNARANVNSQKQAVEDQLDSTANADQANTSALSAAASIGQQPTFSPLGNLFTNVSAAAAQAKLASQAYPYYGTGGAQLYGAGSSGTYGG